MEGAASVSSHDAQCIPSRHEQSKAWRPHITNHTSAPAAPCRKGDMARSSASLGRPPAEPMNADAIAGLNAAAAAAAAAAGKGGAPCSAAGRATGGELTLPPSEELGCPKLGRAPMGPSRGSVGMGSAALSSVPVARKVSESTR